MQKHYIYLKLKLKLNKSNKQKFLKNTVNTKLQKNQYQSIKNITKSRKTIIQISPKLYEKN